ncbi:LysR family transcriptional regulator [Luteolibacter marinus]|uniref:LysR family transcriptional regulator n=1 Tax=Luteolibacter marinus TaxID=2776705 RepID=UPI001865DBB9|nr:LysR family transcriptional regulator [Luteolibacter marinus]
MKEGAGSSPEIDLHGLHLLRLVAGFRGFTAASKAAGLSQSALTRQIQNLEARLGFAVFERTTRSVTITEAGAILLRETEALPNILGGALRRVREECLGASRRIRVGISRELAIGHIPGLFPASRGRRNGVRIAVSQADEVEVLDQVGSSRLDLGILTVPAVIPETIRVTHRMEDRFVAIAGRELSPPDVPGTPADFRKWALGQNWLLPPPNCRSRGLINDWAKRQKLDLQAAMELESFDLMIQLVSTEMGCALVPRRALGPFPRKGRIRRIKVAGKLARELVVVTPRHTHCPEHVAEFADGILFS